MTLKLRSQYSLSILFIGLILIAGKVFGQTYSINQGGTVNTCSGTFYDSGGSSGNYSNNENYSMTFCSDDPNSVIKITFSLFDLASGEYMQVYDGTKYVGYYSMWYAPTIIVGTSGCLTFTFYSNGTTTAAGWIGTFSCLPIIKITQGGTANVCSGVFYDSGGPAAGYGFPENYTMTLCNPTGGQISLAFKTFSLGSGAVMNIYSGPDITSPLIGSYNSTANPISTYGGGINSTCACLTIQFINVSPPPIGSPPPDGWAAEISCVNLSTNPSCSNAGFESGTTLGWIGSAGEVAGNLRCICSTGIIPDRHTVVSGSGLDPYGNFPVVAPNSGQYSLRLGNEDNGSESEQLTQKFAVTPGNTIFTYQYAVVLEDPGHPVEEQPFFRIEMFDQNCDTLLCGQYFVAASANTPGFQTTTGPYGSTVIYKSWTPVSVDLRSYIGDTVTIVFSTGDCSQGAHFGYAYIDCSCGLLEISSTDNTLCPGDPAIELCAPVGYASYTWTPGGQTSRCINIASTGTFTAQMGSFTSCLQGSSITYTVNECTTVPIDLIYFKAEKAGTNLVALSWQIANESSNTSFEIQRSSDQSNFNIIKAIESLGRSTTVNTYSFTDIINKIPKETIYYRLKQIGDDGSVNYSDIRSINFAESSEGPILGPNPIKAGETLKLKYPDLQKSKLTITLRDLSGKTVYSSEILTDNEFIEINIPTAGFEKGIYSLQAISSQSSVVRKVIIN